MDRARWLTALVLLLAPFAPAEEFTSRKAQAAQKELDKARLAARKAHEKELLAAGKSYSKELGDARKAAMQAGQLEEARRVDDILAWLKGVVSQLERGVWSDEDPNDRRPLESAPAQEAQRRYQAAVEAASQSWRGARIAALDAYRRGLEAALQPILKAAKDLDEAERIKAAIRAAEAELDSFRATEGWVVLFRSSDPNDWNTHKQEPERFAMPLASAPAEIRYVRMKRMDTGEQVILALTREELGQDGSEGRYAWMGARTVNEGGTHLGIDNADWLRTFRDGGKIMVGSRRSTGGWGFGHAVHKNDVQYYSWAGEEIPRTVFEIAVTARELPLEEQEHLLR